MLKKSTIKNLNKIVGEENALFESGELEPYSIDEITPQTVLFPNSIDQVSEIMKVATKDSLSVIPWGSGTKISLGNSPTSADIVLCTNRLNRLVEHGASDLIATAECGISFQKLQQELKKENQFLALDPPHIERNATVGGIIATNDSGPERLRYGTSREFLIGITVVKADGSIFKGGSKVVKNVAGYDLPKLYVGSLGTLGILVETTFRLYPIPEYSESFVCSYSNLSDCHASVLALLNSDLVLTSLEIINPELTSLIAKRNDLDLSDKNYSLIVRIKNVEQAVKDQISVVEKICEKEAGNGFILTGKKEDKVWDDICDFPQKFIKTNRVVCKLSFLVTQIPSLLSQIEQLEDKYGVNICAAVRAGNGISILTVKGKTESVEKTLNELRAFMTKIEGSLIILEAPSEIKSGIDIWGNIGSGLGIMKRIKANFDPDNILNPGRFI